MSSFATQVYNILLHASLVAVTPALPSGTSGGRNIIGKPDMIPDNCFIINTVTASDGFPTTSERNNFNGFIRDGNQYHENFGFDITRIKSLWEILDFYKNETNPIGRIRIVTHGWQNWMEFPMFQSGSFRLGITGSQLEAFQDSDETGLRWTLTRNLTGPSPLFHDISSDIVNGIRKINSTLLAPLKLDVIGSTMSGDTKLFLDVVTDYYHLEYGSVGKNTTPFNLLTHTQKTQIRSALQYLEGKIRGRLEGAVLGSAPNTVTVTASHLNNLKSGILNSDPGKLELLGLKKSLPTNIFAPATTNGSLAMANAANPKVENDLRLAIAGHNGFPLFSNRSGEIMFGLTTFHSNALRLSNSVNITGWTDLPNGSDLAAYFMICNDLYMIKNGAFKVTGGSDITSTQRTTIRNGIISISEIIKSRIVGNNGITSNKLNTLRTTIENLSWQESKATNEVITIPEINIMELNAAVGGVTNNFRTNLNNLRNLIKSTSFVDIRGCRVGGAPGYLTKVRNFLGKTGNMPTISAPEWWQSFPDGFQFLGPGTTQPFRIFPKIDTMVSSGFAGSNISAADVTTSFNLWRSILNFNDHFTFISSLFADSNTSRLNFTSLEWRIWQVGGTGVGIPVLNMQAQRVDDIINLNIGDILERFRIIFEIPAGDALDSSQRTSINALHPIITSFKTLKGSIDAANNPSTNAIDTFYNQLGQIVTDIDNINGTTTPGPLQPPLPKNKTKLATYATNVNNYIDTNLSAFLAPFFTNVRTQISHANGMIRYYCNIGLVLPIQSSSHPTITNPTIMISFLTAADRPRLFMEAVRSWMKIQWQGTASQIQKLNNHIDNIPIGSLNDIGGYTRRSIFSDGDPGTNPLGLASHYCPTDDFGDLIVTQP